MAERDDIPDPAAGPRVIGRLRVMGLSDGPNEPPTEDRITATDKLDTSARDGPQPEATTLKNSDRGIPGYRATAAP